MNTRRMEQPDAVARVRLAEA